MRASETPPYPTSDKTGPMSDDEERRHYLELYSRGQELLAQHKANYESDQKFI